MARPGQKRVIDAFLAGKACKESTLSTDGKAIYSYAMMIARRKRNGTIVCLASPSDGGPKISKTTSTHLSEVSYFLVCHGAKMVTKASDL